MLDAQDLIAAATKLWGAPTSKKPHEWRFGAHGSKSINIIDLLWFDHEAGVGGGILELCQKAGIRTNGHDKSAGESGWIFYDYRDEKNDLLFQVVRKPGHKFLQRRPDGGGDWIWNLEGVRRVVYRLHELINHEGIVFVCEGEKDVDNVRALGLIATTNPGGAGKWREEYSAYLSDRDVVILPDNDEPGRNHADLVERSLKITAKSVKVLKLPGLGDKEDVSDWIGRGGTREQLEELSKQTATREELPDAVTFKDFLYYSPENKYLYQKTGTLWPAKAVDLRLPWTGGVKPSVIIARDNPVEQMTWAPGEPRLIKDKLVVQGGWIKSPNATVFNHYKAPHIHPGHTEDAAAWVEHVHYVYPDEADHIIKWLAHRCQHPATKINHALVLGGEQGVGKDSLLHPVFFACGFWNCQSVSPAQVLGRFNSHLKSVILLISEARDLGDVNRPQFYEHLKAVIAAPPDVSLIDEKHTHPYYIPNLTGVIITTNHKAAGIYLSPEDRRHFVAWSPLEVEKIDPDYFDRLWEFYASGGLRDIASYLHELDLSDFDPKAPPPKTPAFWEIVAAGQNPEVGDLETVLTNLGKPDIVTLSDLVSVLAGAEPDFVMALKKNQRMVSRWMEDCGYKVVRNPGNKKQGYWWFGGKNHTVYGKSTIPNSELLKKVRREKQGLPH